MALTRLQLGELYFTKGGELERRFLGSIVHVAQQILQGGYADPTQAQTDWANAVVGTTLADHTVQARAAVEWGLVNNVTFQDAGGDVSDSDVDYITAEYAKTYVA